MIQIKLKCWARLPQHSRNSQHRLQGQKMRAASSQIKENLMVTARASSCPSSKEMLQGAPWMPPCKVGWRKRHGLVFTIPLHFISVNFMWTLSPMQMKQIIFFQVVLQYLLMGEKKHQVSLVAVCYFNASSCQLRVMQWHIFSVFHKKVRGGLHIITVYFSIFIFMGTWRFHSLLDQN